MIAGKVDVGTKQFLQFLPLQFFLEINDAKSIDLLLRQQIFFRESDDSVEKGIDIAIINL